MADGAVPSFLKPLPTAKPPPAFLKPVPDFLAPVEPPVAAAPAPTLDTMGRVPPRPFDYPSEVAGFEQAPEPEDEPPSGIGEFASQSGAALASGYTGYGVTNLLGVAAAEPVLPGMTKHRQVLKDFMSWPEEQQNAFRVELDRQHSMDATILQGWLSDLKEGTILPEEIDELLGPDPVVTPMRQRPAYIKARELEAWKERNFGPTPTYEEGIPGVWRALLEGLGTVGASATTYAAGGPFGILTGGASALASGLGETVQNVYSPENIAAAESWQRGQPGAQPGLSSPSMADLLAGQGADQMAGLSAPAVGETEMQRRVDAVLQARLDQGAGLGLAAGATDLAPLMTLFNLIPGMKNVGLVGRIATQAFTEGGQEGVQQFLQNTAVGRALSSGLMESVGLGGGVGALSQIISEVIQLGTPGRGRAPGPLTQEELDALKGRLQPSTGGRLDVDQPTLPMNLPEQIPPGGARPLQPMPPDEGGPLPLAPGEEQFELPLEQPGTTPTVQPNVPGPGPSEVAPVTSGDVLAAYNAAKDSEQYPINDPRRTAAHENYYALASRFVTEDQARKEKGTVLPVGPTPARPAGGEPAGLPPATGEAAPAPEAIPPATPLPVAEPPAMTFPSHERNLYVKKVANGWNIERPSGARVSKHATQEEAEAALVAEGYKQDPRKPDWFRKEPPPVFRPEARVKDDELPVTGPVEAVAEAEPAEQPAPTAPVPPAPPVPAKPTPPFLARVEPEPPKPVTTKDVLGPVPPKQTDLKSFVTGQGGVKPTPNLLAQDAEQQVGLLDNDGMTMDNMRQAMEDAGYIDAGTDANAAEQLIIDAMGQDAPKIYPKRALDQRQAAESAGRKQRQAELDEMTGPVETAIEATGRSDITEQERDQMIALAHSTGDADEAVDTVLRRREEPTEAKTVPTEEPIPFDTGEPLPSEEGAEGKQQLFIPGSRETQNKPVQITTGPELRDALKTKGVATDQWGRTYSIRPRPGGGLSLFVDKEEVAKGLTPKSLIDVAVIQHKARQDRIAPKKPQKRGVTDLSLFSDEHKQKGLDLAAAEPARLTEEATGPVEDLDLTPAEVAEEKFHRFIKSLPEAGREDIETEAWQNAFSVETVDEYADDAERWKAALATAEMLVDQRGGPAAEPRDKYGSMVPDGFTVEEVNQYLTNAENKVEPTTDREVDYWETVGQPDQGLVGSTPDRSDLDEDEGLLWGEDADADQQREVDDQATLDLATVDETNPERVPKAGATKTFTDVTMSTTTPMNADAAYADAGLDPDRAKNMTPEGQFQALAALFRSKFGFKSVSRVGEYGPAKGRNAVDMMLDGYRAIRAMMHVLGMPETGGSLGGTLSLTIGRITRRSAFLGVYNPEDHSVELVGRSNGFAHEWAHALDHWLMENVFGPIVAGGDKLASRFTRNAGLNPGNTLDDHFIRLMNVLFYDDAALAAKVMDLQIKAAKVYGPKHAKAGQPTPEALNAQRMLDDVAAGRSKLIRQGSDYYKNAIKYGKGSSYWSNPAEMLARAFESYVAWKVHLTDPDFPNNFMTKGEAAYISGADTRLAETFPKAGDRMRIFAAFDTLMGIVNTQTALGGSISAMPTGNELLDDDMFYVHAARDARNAKEKAAQRTRLARWKNRLMQATSLSGWNLMLDEIRDNLVGRFPGDPDTLTWAQRGSMMFKGIFFTEAAIANTLVNRPQNARARVFMHAIATQMFEIAPGSGELATETWSEAVSAYVRQYSGKLENILDAHGIPTTVPRDPKSPQGMADVAQRNRLESILSTGVEMPGTTADERRAAAQIRTQIFDEIWRDAGRSGLDIGYVEDAPYLPIIPEPHAIHRNEKGFIKAATTLYELVFDRAAGVTAVDRAVLKDAIQDIKGWNTPSTLNDPDIVRLRAKMGREEKALKDLRRKQAVALRPDLMQAQVDALAKDLQDTADELATHIKPLWAHTKAEQWHEAFIRGEYSAMDTLGPQTRHTKERVLPSESQQIMAEFIVKDPIVSAAIYINSMARKIEYSSRFGQQSGGRRDFENLITRPKSPLLAEMKAKGLNPARAEDRVEAILHLTDPMLDNRLEMLMLEAQRAGALSEDLETLSEQVQFMTGRKKEGSTVMRELPNLVYAFGTLSLMPRAWWTSLIEAVTTLARTGDIKVTGKVLAHNLREFTTPLTGLNDDMRAFFADAHTKVEDIHDLARTIGLISTEGQEIMLQVTLGDVPMNSRMSRFMAEFYERIGLAALTRMQKRAVLAGYNMWLNKLLRMYKGEPGAPAGDKAVAEANLADLGYAKSEILPLDNWLHARGRERQMNSADAKTPIGQRWAAGARRFVHSVVQEGTKATSPRMMSHPMGRLTFGLMRFAYTFTRNILIRPIRQAIRDEELRVAAGETRGKAAARAFRDNLMYRGAMGFGALWLGHMLVGLLREYLFNYENFARHEKEGDLFDWLTGIAASRTGVFGAADVVVQAVKGIRYSRDITSMSAGPFLNILLAGFQDAANLAYNNSPNTNTAERKFTLDVLRTLQTPIIMAMLTAAPGGRYVNMLWAGLGMLASSNSIMQWEASMMAGPPDQRAGAGGTLKTQRPTSTRPK